MRAFSSLPIVAPWLILGLILWTPGVSVAQTPAAGEIPQSSVDFLQEHCLDCHDGPDGEGGMDVTSLVTNLDDPADYETWVRVYDRIEKGEMPPPEDGALDRQELESFLPPTGDALETAARFYRQRDGRVQGRRLTNLQLQRTLQDLLRIDVPLARLMPPESRSNGFVHLADAQTMSHFQLKTHLRVIDAALDATIDRATRPSRDLSLDYAPAKIARKKPGQRNREPELRKGLAVTWSSGLIFYGRISSTTVRDPGWYRITVTASAVKPTAGSNSKTPPTTATEPGVWCSVRSGECVSHSPLLNWIGSFRATQEPQTMTWDAWLSADHKLEIRPADMTLPRAGFQGGQVGFGEGEDKNVPGVAIHHLTMERIHPAGEVNTVRRALFGRDSLHFSKQAKRSLPNLSKLDDADVSGRLSQQIQRFSQLAFRRPTEREAWQPYADFTVAAWHQSMAEGADREHAYVEALRAGYRAVLCSPRFLYLCEYTDGEGRLDNWSVASRLSYFLCGSMPDEQLRDAAAEGELNSASELQHHTDRLLATPRGQRFIENFASQWLDLTEINDTEPDRRLFRDFDLLVQNAMLQETHLFLQKLLDENRPVAQLIDSDETFLNERLARYYGIDESEILDDVSLDDQMRCVSLDRTTHRGGLLSHGSVLKVTANGNDTSPVLRGVWVCERLLGEEIPPPPSNIPAVEPDIRGATTIRELLAKHASDASCASCHRHFDPPGFAMEVFDAGGQWRDRYLQLKGKKYQRGPRVDPSYTMTDGQSFETFDEFRQLVAADDERLAANLASQLLVYATAAKIQFSDRPVLRQIVDQTRSTGYGFRSILHAVVASDTFLNK
ncbi:DUF1592 domain-containing protein [Allorhodopirellula solitaria]|uniref:Planctomycete cytochrome C n=1 Tax=Allorhodopirellula solitaria TaxID=2527987 RepID=A0A5C5YIP1_9BACT|nr:DUF1592 domain-containing protein [Allorhodopirellula solitaria]TWT74730.1 hypothetical protein CA85_00150 [Allorhodopirellula solitaria]